MKFRIRQTESLPAGLAEGVEGQIRRAREALSGPHGVGEAAHRSRRTIKRARALLKMARPVLTAECYGRANVTMRDAARCVARLRDADVLIETAQVVRSGPTGSSHSHVLSRLERVLAAERAALHSSALGSDGPVAQARELLGQVVVDWPAPGQVDDVRLLAAGLGASYESVRRHANLAFSQGLGGEAYHELRKRAKDLRHQLEFLSSLCPETLRPTAKGFRRLTDLLGDANDVAIFSVYVLSAGGLEREERQRLLECLDDLRSELWQQATPLGVSLFGEETGRFVDRVERCWTGRSA